MILHINYNTIKYEYSDSSSSLRIRIYITPIAVGLISDESKQVKRLKLVLMNN